MLTEGEMRALKGAGGDLSIWGCLKMFMLNVMVLSIYNCMGGRVAVFADNCGGENAGNF